jgi:hypothetical protein
MGDLADSREYEVNILAGFPESRLPACRGRTSEKCG